MAGEWYFNFLTMCFALVFVEGLSWLEKNSIVSCYGYWSTVGWSFCCVKLKWSCTKIVIYIVEGFEWKSTIQG